jgi:hypothetical protein
MFLKMKIPFFIHTKLRRGHEIFADLRRLHYMEFGNYCPKVTSEFF